VLVFLPEVFCEVVDEHLPVTTISEPRDALVDRMVRQKVSNVHDQDFCRPMFIILTRHGGRKMSFTNLIHTLRRRAPIHLDPTMKRHLSDNAELEVLRGQLIAKIASLLERTEEEIAAAAAVAPSATILELGLTSAMGIALKGWCFKTLEAELTTFELLKLPFDDVVLALEAARRQDIGARLPSLNGAALAPAHESDHLSIFVAAAGAAPAP
jgi:hypothetical protein